MKSFKQHCIALRKKDRTLNEISKITGRSKTSVFYHIKNIPLGKAKQSKIRNQTIERAKKVAANRKGKALRSHTTFTKWTPSATLLVAHLVFDGEILRQRCIYNNRSLELTKRVTHLMKSLYKHPPITRTNAKTGVMRVAFYNVSLSSFLHAKAMELLKNITTMPKSSQREFLRAFFDDEGCMDVRLKRNLRRIRGYQNDRTILVIVQKLLLNFDIVAKLQGKNEVVIVGKENLQRFQTEINFSKGVRLNPRRTNSLWKRDLEKRELLALAISSYKS